MTLIIAHGLRLALLVAACAFAQDTKPESKPVRKPAGSTLRIVKDALVADGNFWAVKGSINNPNGDGVKNVVIKYYIWKKWMGKDGHGSAIKDTGGLVIATLKYLPSKQTIDFVATSRNAPRMTEESGLLPEPIEAEITAEWDE